MKDKKEKLDNYAHNEEPYIEYLLYLFFYTEGERADNVLLQYKITF